MEKVYIRGPCYFAVVGICSTPYLSKTNTEGKATSIPPPCLSSLCEVCKDEAWEGGGGRGRGEASSIANKKVRSSSHILILWVES
jgi:hypothetical protein